MTEEITRVCPVCGKSFGRKKDKTKLESWVRFFTRKGCCRSCGRTRSDVKNRRAYHKRAIKKKLGDHCEICKGTEFLDCHHLDGNYKNNSLDNLITLCRGCHLNI